MMRRKSVEQRMTIGAVQHQHPEPRRETLGLAPPGTDKARRHDQKARPVGTARKVAFDQERQRLHRLAEAHVVGEHAAEARFGERAQPAIPGLLIGPQFRRERRGRLGHRGRSQRAQLPAELDQRAAAVERHTAPFERLGQFRQPPGLGAVEAVHQPAHGIDERREFRRAQGDVRSIGKPLVEHQILEELVEVEACFRRAFGIER